MIEITFKKIKCFMKQAETKVAISSMYTHSVAHTFDHSTWEAETGLSEFKAT